MNEKVLHTLEYDKIINLLVDKATSDPGRKLCRELLPMTDIEDIEKAQTQTADAFSYVLKKGSMSFGNTKDIGYSLKSLEIGSTLSIVELLSIAGLLENAERVKKYGEKDREETPDDSLTELFEALSPLSDISKEIRRCIISEEEIADDASPRLKTIRRNKIHAGEKIHSQLNSLVNGSARTYLQDAVITMRNNRYCLPVKSEYKANVPGMVHDQSSTGSTVFIEPASVVELNNKIRELELEEKEEIGIILRDLSARCGVYTKELEINVKTMALLDFIFAKAALAADENASRPVFNSDRIIRIRKGRHPLLDKKSVVPIDIHLGEDFDLLVITGPNTGGKTVSLKTVGLFTLMGQAGLHIPAADRSALSVFTEVYADIGDEQSIEQSLSTFSSHMTSIVKILERADENSLCLFDELGAGTDPTEGAALAIAILNYLHDRGIRTMATTHYSELKVYALSTDFVENACCEFDVESLRPTYTLLIGIPGKSNAFAISKKLGLSDEIIEAARNQITEEKESFEDLMATLENNRVALERDREAIDASKARIEGLERDLRNRLDKVSESKEKILREANEEARQILQEAKDYADETIRIMNKSGGGISMKELEAKRSEVRGRINNTNEKLSIKKEEAVGKIEPKKLKKGDTVKVLSMGVKGVVNTLPDAKGNLYVQCGILRSQVNINDLELVDEDSVFTEGRKFKGGNTSKLRMSKSFAVPTEINLLGKRVDEAIAELDKYLDDAYLAHLPSVRIVHGKGTGALRSAVQDLLKKNKCVKSYRLGEHGEGDAGVTIAEFK